MVLVLHIIKLHSKHNGVEYVFTLHKIYRTKSDPSQPNKKDHEIFESFLKANHIRIRIRNTRNRFAQSHTIFISGAASSLASKNHTAAPPEKTQISAAAAEEETEMTEVILHLYDVTNSGSEKTNNTILQINKIFKDRIGLGGIFHSAVSLLSFLFVYGNDEWSFGYCEQGSGVFSCPSGQNPMYTYREKLVFGKTNLTIFKVNQILRELSREWPGSSYDLLSKNCNHFCDEFCDKLGVPKLPGWVNRFANAGDTAVEIAGNTAFRLKQAKTEIVSSSKVAYRYLAGMASNVAVRPENGSPGGTTPRFQATWFKNLIAAGDKPSTSAVLDEPNQEVIRLQQADTALLRQNSHRIS
ncbi:DeSI-like protein [Drosera capensis]